MLAPLKSMYVTGEFRERAVAGTGLPDSQGIRRHIGVDLRASVGTPVYAMESGKVSIVDNVGLKLVEIVGTRTIRYLHLSKNILLKGQLVTAGQLVGYSGDSGGVLAHLHVDVRKNGTAYNDSLYNYYNPMSLITTNQGDTEVFKNEAEVQQAYQLLRGKNATSAEVKGWIGQPQQRFFVVGKPEADGYRSEHESLKKNFIIVRNERDVLRGQSASKTVLIEDLERKLAVMTADRDKLQAQLDASIEAYNELKAEHKKEIDALNEIIKIKDDEINRLQKEIDETRPTELSAWQLIIIGIKKLFQRRNNNDSKIQ